MNLIGSVHLLCGVVLALGGSACAALAWVLRNGIYGHGPPMTQVQLVVIALLGCSFTGIVQAVGAIGLIRGRAWAEKLGLVLGGLSLLEGLGVAVWLAAMWHTPLTSHVPSLLIVVIIICSLLALGAGTLVLLLTGRGQNSSAS
jgi:hypothetical protein